MTSSKIIVINGPNLGRLDLREKSFYGDLNYEQLLTFIERTAKDLNLEVEVKQSDSEEVIVGWLHQASDNKEPVILNPAAFTHYSVAIRDAALLLKAPLIEVHLSNPLAREEFRHTSLISGIASGTIAGFKEDSYRLALIAMQSLLV
jgi:3-dehydroquinate dehydratase-2